MTNASITYHPSELPFPFSKAVTVNGVHYLSGQVSMSSDATPLYGSIEDQTRIIMTNISTTLEALGVSLEYVFKVTVWLSDMRHFRDFNAAYVQYFSAALPARSVVSAKLAFDLDVEVEVHAVASV